ncbi:MAG TPA: DUF4262 domain-containing protein [Urbifossiella sp.]|jgi:hypothetical protein|nr:DUF4262 domain-containing protein [Urbifossiella sp.]
MSRNRPDPQDDSDRTIFGHVDRVGWAVILIPDGAEGPGFAFSLGLHETHGHPEVLLIGQKTDNMYGLVNHMGGRVRGGDRFDPGEPTEGVIERFPVWFVPVEQAHYRDYLGYANWYYGSTDYPVFQCVWPDGAGRFPWDAGVSPGLRTRQPVLGPAPAREPL